MEVGKQNQDSTQQSEEVKDANEASKSRSKASPYNNRRIRQAVVIIHGIGEQRPMDTLRSFVDSVLGNALGQDSKYRSKPDTMNETLETRCLFALKSRYRPSTDFYEYYWAHHIRDSKYTHVLSWLKSLMFRCPSQIPRALLAIYFLSWALLFLVLYFFLCGLLANFHQNCTVCIGLIQNNYNFIVGILIFISQWTISYFALHYLADAARYLMPSPENIETRNKIRAEGVKLLRTLHASGRYSRIIIVGHSLGSVIGYDIIRNLWTELRKPIYLNPQKQPELKAFRVEVEKLGDKDITPAKIEAFQQCQHRLWREFRSVGIPWLVTDFITLGSPLAHAELLMADSKEELIRKKAQYEYPCCPPIMEEDVYYSQTYNITQNGTTKKRNIDLPHHGAPFSCIRWTNLYFPYRYLLFGDLIAGPLNDIFGKGIRDIPVKPSTGKILQKTLYSHICYWTKYNNHSLDKLCKSLKLDFLYSKDIVLGEGSSGS